MAKETTAVRTNEVLTIKADRDFWPTVVEALAEVKAARAKDPALKIKGEDGLVDADTVIELLEYAVKRDPTSKLRPLGFKYWNKPANDAEAIIGRLNVMPEKRPTRKGCGRGKSCRGC